MLFKAVLLLVLVAGTLFAWHARSHLPSMALLAALLAAGAALLLHSPFLTLVGLGLAAGLAVYASLRRR